MTQKWNLQDIRPAKAGAEKHIPPREALPTRQKVDIAQRPAKRSEPQYATHTYQPPATHIRSEQTIDPDLATIDIIDGNGQKRKRVIITVAIAVCILIFGFSINVFLGGATVTVHPKVRDTSIQAEFSASVSPQVGELGYELLTLEASGEKQVTATGKENVSEKATGKLFVYNKSDSAQHFVASTRFETPEGLIYRAVTNIDIPPAKKDEKGAVAPGSVVVDVASDGTGEQYNVSPTRFTVPGLKGGDLYESIYAESKAAFMGGFEGEKYIIDENELATAKQALHVELRDKLLGELKEKRPAGFVVYDNAITFAFDSLPATEYGDSLATIKEKARLQVPIFKEDQFAPFLAKKAIPDYTGDPVTLGNPYSLSFEYISATTTVSDIAPLSVLDFKLTGDVRIIWKFDDAKLKADLVSLDKKEATSVFSKYPSISNAQAEIRPFWRTSFPKDSDEIEVKTIIE